MTPMTPITFQLSQPPTYTSLASSKTKRNHRICAYTFLTLLVLSASTLSIPLLVRKLRQSTFRNVQPEQTAPSNNSLTTTLPTTFTSQTTTTIIKTIVPTFTAQATSTIKTIVPTFTKKLIPTSPSTTMSTIVLSTKTKSSPIETNSIVTPELEQKIHQPLQKVALGLASLGGGFLYHSWQNNKKLQHQLDIETFKFQNLAQKLEYQSQHHTNHQKDQENEIGEYMNRKKNLQQHYDEIMKHYKTMNDDLHTLQSNFNELLVVFEMEMQDCAFHVGNVNILRTNIAAIQPRLVQEEHTLRTTNAALIQSSNDLNLVNERICVIDTNRKLQLYQSMMGVMLWHHQAQINTPSKTKKIGTAAKDFAINVMLSSAFDYFNVGGYINEKTKWFSNVQTAPKVTTILNPLPGSPINVMDGNKIVGNIRMKHIIQTTSVARKESWLKPVANLITNHMGKMLTTEQKVNIAVMKRNTLLRELQSGWEKHEIMELAKIMPNIHHLEKWADENGFGEAYKECQNEIHSAIGMV